MFILLLHVWKTSAPVYESPCLAFKLPPDQPAFFFFRLDVYVCGGRKHSSCLSHDSRRYWGGFQGPCAKRLMEILGMFKECSWKSFCLVSRRSGFIKHILYFYVWHEVLLQAVQNHVATYQNVIIVIHVHQMCVWWVMLVCCVFTV